MLDHNECYFGIVDLHAITTPAQPAILRQNVYQCVAQYIACGLDPEKCHQFVQSHVIGHTELAWVLTCITPIGELQRMTQFKDKVAKLGFKVSENIDGDDLKFEHQGARAQASINTGLLCYPILMAADILLYNADRVPVGEDQKQHIELSRDIAQAFNSMFEVDFFPLPEPRIQKEAARIMSLRDGLKKMSKSDPSDNSRINMIDGPDLIAQKIRRAKTDPEPLPETLEELAIRPEALNLITIFSALSDRTIQSIITEFAGNGFGDFKNALSDLAVSTLGPIGDEMQRLMGAPDEVDKILHDGALKAKAIAAPIVAEAKKIVGFLNT